MPPTKGLSGSNAHQYTRVMGTNSKAEACGRCSMTTAMDVTAGTGKNPFDGDRIEIDEDQLRLVSPHVIALGALKQRLNEWATRVTYGR